ncbi:hypothetical protein LV92_02446 [Arenibacter echinorum]|uniref:Uncharacterized protein n=1 Tax=Arenibacter echinorum TaxID=440515 RepID=A0A327R5Y4_9FLAO|nr:hypothetical protein LV92_02446 [Arenibacter echinorum]
MIFIRLSMVMKRCAIGFPDEKLIENGVIIDQNINLINTFFIRALIISHVQ